MSAFAAMSAYEEVSGPFRRLVQRISRPFDCVAA
jgi:hypothetical protein